MSIPPFPFIDMYADFRRAKDIYQRAVEEQRQVRDPMLCIASWRHRQNCSCHLCVCVRQSFRAWWWWCVICCGCPLRGRRRPVRTPLTVTTLGT
jgi:hypothetical protein